MMTSHHTVRLRGYDFTLVGRLIAAAVFVAATFAMQTVPAEAQGNRPQSQQPAPQQPAEPEELEVEEIELTQQQIDALIATVNEIVPITATLKDDAEPSEQMMSQMEAIAKKHGFKDFDEFGDVEANIGMVFGGIDPQSKKYDPQELIRREIAAVQANPKIPAKQKAQIVKELQQAATSIPKLKFPANAELVAKNYDRLRPLMEGEQQPSQQPPPQQQQRQQPRGR